MTLDFQLKKPVEFVHAYLSDMQKFVTVHPIIYRIDSLGENKYLVYERLKLGFIPYSFTYVVSVESNVKDRTVIIRTTVKKMVKIEMYYRLKANGEHSVVNEVITFKSRLPVKSLMGRIFRNQHRQLFLNIEQVKE
jgi:carbon monoxide dehydrogenase subunit G